jgi:hypothetical protein
MVGGQHGPVGHFTQQIAVNTVFSQARTQANVSG